MFSFLVVNTYTTVYNEIRHLYQHRVVKMTLVSYLFVATSMMLVMYAVRVKLKWRSCVEWFPFWVFWQWLSCGTVALYGPFFFAYHKATVFTPSKTFETVQKKSCAAFLTIFVMKSGASTIKHTYFVSLIFIYILLYLLTY